MATHPSGTIDTREVDGYRQGVEITAPEHVAAGVAKIWSGYDDHKLPQVEFGQVGQFDYPVPFEEQQRYVSSEFIQASQGRACFERMTRDRVARYFDGSLHPLGSPSGSNEFFPKEVLGIKGAIQSGNENEFGEVDDITDQFVPGRTGTMGPFVDSRALITRETYRTGRVPKFAVISPYSDAFPYKIGLVLPVSASQLHISARLAMSGTDANTRLLSGSKSMGVGFTYDGTRSGTDSLAFGGFKF